MNCELAQIILADPKDPAVDRSLLLEAASHALTCEACRAFVEDLNRIESALRLPGDDSIDLPPGGYSAMADRLAIAGHSRGRSRWRLMAAAASVAIIAGSSFLFWPRPVAQQSNSTPPHPDSQLVFSPAEMQHSTKAFAEVAQAFDHRATWVWTADHAADMGVVQSPVDPAQPVLLLKLVLRSGKQILATGDLAIVSGHSARLSLPLDDGKKIRYVIDSSSDQPDRIGITAELLGEDGAATPLAALSTRLQARPGQPLSAGEMATTTGQFEVIADFARAEPMSTFK